MDILVLRLILLLSSIVASIFFGIVPLQIFHSLRKTALKGSASRLKKLSLTICFISCFSGGVLFSTCVLNMVPEIQLHYKNIRDHHFWNAHYPLPEFIICMGFFFVYFCEELFLIVSDRKIFNKPIKKKVTFQEPPEVAIPMLPLNELNVETIPKQPVSTDRRNSITAKYRPHPHSHLIRSIVLFYSLALHSFIEGLSYGLRHKQKVLINFFLITSTHQCILAFAFGVQLARTHLSHKKLVILAVIMLSLATPSGALCGLSLGQNSSKESLKETTILIFEALAAGSFLYVIFFEIVFHQRNNEHSNFLKLFAMFVGFIIVASITFGQISKFKAGNEIHDLHRPL